MHPKILAKKIRNGIIIFIEIQMKKERKFLIMKNCRKNALKSSNGITLIALVITIVLNAVAWSKERKNLLKYNKTLANTVNPL